MSHRVCDHRNKLFLLKTPTYYNIFNVQLFKFVFLNYSPRLLELDTKQFQAITLHYIKLIRRWWRLNVELFISDVLNKFLNGYIIGTIRLAR